MDAVCDSSATGSAASYTPLPRWTSNRRPGNGPCGDHGAGQRRRFEKLPLEQDLHLLRNVLYSGVWQKYNVAVQEGRRTGRGGRNFGRRKAGGAWRRPAGRQAPAEGAEGEASGIASDAAKAGGAGRPACKQASSGGWRRAAARQQAGPGGWHARAGAEKEPWRNMSVMTDNPYAVLGRERNASPDEVKKAYRKKARENHPDLNPGDPAAAERMNKINEAYDRIMNPEKYAARDRRASAAGGYGGAGGARGYGQGRPRLRRRGHRRRHGCGQPRPRRADGLRHGRPLRLDGRLRFRLRRPRSASAERAEPATNPSIPRRRRATARRCARPSPPSTRATASAP